jgi:hypothetical protein
MADMNNIFVAFVDREPKNKLEIQVPTETLKHLIAGGAYKPYQSKGGE